MGSNLSGDTQYQVEEWAVVKQNGPAAETWMPEQGTLAQQRDRIGTESGTSRQVTNGLEPSWVHPY